MSPFFIITQFNLEKFIFKYIRDIMIYLEKGIENALVLNINNNARPNFTTYVLEFTHIMSKEVKSYTIDTTDPLQYSQNIRYCTIILPLDTDDLNYEGEYQLNIYGNGDGYTDYPVFTGISILEGTQEQPLFTQYISPNEVNENYIYIQD
jgi:hypothetical protein